MPTLPEKMVPEPLRPWLVDISERACFPPLEFVAAPALVGLGAIVGRSVGIRPNGFDDYLVVPNQWGGIIAPPGAMKTHAITEALKPVSRLEALARQEYEAQANQVEAHKDRIQSEIDRIKREMKSAVRTGEELDELEHELAEKKCSLRRLRPPNGGMSYRTPRSRNWERL